MRLWPFAKKIKSGFQWLMDRVDVPDRFVFIGLALVAIGLWGIYSPLAPLFVGLALIALGIAGARK